MNHDERMKIVTLNLKRQRYGQIYVIVVMHTYLLVEL